MEFISPGMSRMACGGNHFEPCTECFIILSAATTSAVRGDSQETDGPGDIAAQLQRKDGGPHSGPSDPELIK